MNQTNPIVCTIDLTRPGRNLGYLQVPHSVHRSAYGVIPVPVGSIVGAADGPNVFLMAGNHGDEYEGQVILSELLRTLDPGQVNGRITILPMANFPAAEAGLRTSPIDQVNMNRIFPGAPRGTPTLMIANYIEEVLMEGVDLFLDLHSGGSSFLCVPHGMTLRYDGDPHADMRRKVVDEIGVSCLLYGPPDPDEWYSTSAAHRKGAAGFTLELGGAGTVDPAIRRGAQAGLLRALAAVGAYTGPTTDDRLFEKTLEAEKEAMVFADEPGLYEPMVQAGTAVKAGQVAARVHFPETPGKPPLEVRFDEGGFVLARRQPARVIRGDSLFHMAVI